MSESLLEGFPIIIRIPVQWGEMDAYGHVNNAVFFRYFESARIAYLERCGFIESYSKDKIGAILHSTQARFRNALFHPDVVRVGARGTDVQEDRFTMEYLVVSEAQEAIAAEGNGVIVSFDYVARQKVAIPPAVRAGIEALEREQGAVSREQ